MESTTTPPKDMQRPLFILAFIILGVAFAWSTYALYQQKADIRALHTDRLILENQNLTLQAQIDAFTDTKNTQEAETPEKADDEAYSLYTNESLGISFSYPSSFGEPQEHMIYKSQDLSYISFSEEPAHFRFSSALSGDGMDVSDRVYEFASCETYMNEGFRDGEYFPTTCSMIDTYALPVQLLEVPKIRFGTGAKSYAIKTQQGIWTLSATEERLYDDLDRAIASLKSL